MGYVPKGTAYPGVLSQPIELPRRGLLESEDAFNARFGSAADAALQQRWAALFGLFKIDPAGAARWVELCFALARRHVPGFKVRRGNPRHRPPIWKGPLSLSLYADVMAMRRLGHSEEEIFPRLLKMTRYRKLRITPASLRRRFLDADRNMELPNFMSRLKAKYGDIADDWVIDAAADDGLKRKLASG